VPEQLDGIASVGFSAIWLDRAGPGGESLDRALRKSLGGPQLESDDGRFAYYDLRPFDSQQLERLGADAVATLRRATLAARPN
jgi:hypothetical protein